MQHHRDDEPLTRRSALLPASARTLTGLGLSALMVGAFAPSSQASVAVTAPHSETVLASSYSPASGEDDRDEDAEDQDEAADSEEDSGEDSEAPEMEDSELVLVMDASGSMSAQDAGDTTRIEAARQALHSVVDSLEDHQQVGLRVFAAEVSDVDAPEACEDSELVVEVGSDNRSDLSEAIDAYDAVGGRTPLAYALEQAAGDLSEEGNRTIVLVSDGEENCAPDPCEAAEAIAEQGIDVAIHTVGFQIEDSEAAEAREQLQCIAEAGGGEYHDATDAETLTHTLERLSYRAFQPFSLHGEEVEPGSNQDNAPPLQPGEQYVGTFEYETMYYRVPRTMENSTLHVGLATYNDSEEHWDQAEIELLTMGDNRTCGRSRVDWWGSSGANLFRTAQVAATPYYDSEHLDAGCGEDEELLLAIHSGGRYGEGDEILGQPFELVVEEESDPINGEDYYNDYDSNGLPWDDEDFGWIEMERDRENDDTIYAGSSLNNATPLEAGETYDTDILPGEVQVYRLPGDWNEQIQVEAFFPEPDSTLSEHLSSNYTNVHVDILSPYRGSATDNRSSSGSEIGSGRERIHPQNATTLHRFSHPIWWPNRYDTLSSGPSSASIAGDYFVVLSADPSEDNVSFAMPYRLTVDSFEVLDAETPDYPDEDALAGEELTAPPQEQDKEASGDQEDDEDAADPAQSTEPDDGTDAEEQGSDPDEDGQDETGEPVAAEQTSGLGSSTGVLVGLGALGLLLLAGGGLFLGYLMKSSRRDS